MPLTDSQIRALRAEGRPRKRYDGRGLYIEVAPTGTKKWRFRYAFGGKQKLAALGIYPEVSLCDAREKAEDLRRMLREGVDPSVRKKRAAQEAESPVTFESVALEWLEKAKTGWRHHHSVITETRVRRQILPRIGGRDITAITPVDILELCRAVAIGSSNYISHVVLSLCSWIFRHGIVTGRVTSDPCRDIATALPAHRHKPMAALTDPKDIARLLKAIDAYEGDFRTVCMLPSCPCSCAAQGSCATPSGRSSASRRTSGAFRGSA